MFEEKPFQFWCGNLNSGLQLSFQLYYPTSRCCYGEWSTLTYVYYLMATTALNNILMLCFLYCIIGLCSQEEERLVRDLFRGYNKLIRPVQNMTQKVEVAFGLAFIQLINVVSLQKQQHRYSLLNVSLIFVA